MINKSELYKIATEGVKDLPSDMFDDFSLICYLADSNLIDTIKAIYLFLGNTNCYSSKLSKEIFTEYRTVISLVKLLTMMRFSYDTKECKLIPQMTDEFMEDFDDMLLLVIEDFELGIKYN